MSDVWEIPELQGKGRKTQRAWEKIMYPQVGNAENRGQATVETRTGIGTARGGREENAHPRHFWVNWAMVQQSWLAEPPVIQAQGIRSMARKMSIYSSK